MQDRVRDLDSNVNVMYKWQEYRRKLADVREEILRKRRAGKLPAIHTSQEADKHTYIHTFVRLSLHIHTYIYVSH